MFKFINSYSQSSQHGFNESCNNGFIHTEAYEFKKK